MTRMAVRGQESPALSDDERAAVKQYAAERRRAAGRTGEEKAAADLQDVLDRIASLEGDDRVLAEQVHRIVTTAAPELAPRTWYGFPAYAKDGKIVCFFQYAAKFKARYATLGFQDTAALDDGGMWPTHFALTSIGAEEEARITELVRRAVA